MYEMDPPSLDSSGSAEDVDDDDRDWMKNRGVVRNKNLVNLVSEIAGFFV
jgi:hypothetical protein